MTEADKTMHLQHFGTNPADIPIKINPGIRTRIPGHFWLKFWRWWRFALSACSCYYCHCYRCYSTPCTQPHTPYTIQKYLRKCRK